MTTVLFAAHTLLFLALIALAVRRWGMEVLFGHRAYLITYLLGVPLAYQAFGGLPMSEFAVGAGALAGIITFSKGMSGLRDKMANGSAD